MKIKFLIVWIVMCKCFLSYGLYPVSNVSNDSFLQQKKLQSNDLTMQQLEQYIKEQELPDPYAFSDLKNMDYKTVFTRLRNYF